MTDSELLSVSESWKDFEHTPAHRWLIGELESRVTIAQVAILEAEPIDLILHPFRFISLWHQLRQSEYILKEIDEMKEQAKKI